MLDLAFVRGNLELVEQKLRDRGLDPAAVLGDFRRLEAERRQAITRAETLKAERNRASEAIAQLKKNKQDASAQIETTKQMREQIATLEKEAEELDARMRTTMAGIPNLPHESVPVGTTLDD